MEVSDRVLAEVATELGGPFAIDEVVRRRIMLPLMKPEHTLRVLWEQAVKEGWTGHLLNLTLGELADLVRGPEKKKRTGKPHMKMAEAKAHHQSIVDYVREHPGTLARDIREALGAERVAFGSLMLRLCKQGRIASSGPKRPYTYYLPPPTHPNLA